MHRFHCCVLFGLLFAPIVAAQPQPLQSCQDPRLNNCASCVIGAPFSAFPLQTFSKPDFTLPEPLQIANSYDIRRLRTDTLAGSDLTCTWNRETKSCSVFTDFDSSPPPKFVNPRRAGRSRDLDFDLYTRMEYSRDCTGGENGLVTIGHNTFPPYSLSPRTSMPCYGPCSSEMQYCSTLRTPEHLFTFSSNACFRTAFLETGINAGLFPRDAFSHKLYATAEEVVNAIESYNVSMAFPVNGQVAKLRNSKGILSSASTAVLWRPDKVFNPALLAVQAFLPVLGLFGVLFIGCLVAGVISVAIEISVPNSMFFETPEVERRNVWNEIRTGKPLGRGFLFSLSTLAGVGIGDFQPMGLVSKVFCTIMVICGLNVVSIVNGNFTVNIGTFTAFQPLDWLQRGESTIVTIDESTTASSLADAGYNVRRVTTGALQQECALFGSATDNRAMAGDVNAINVCNDFLMKTVSSVNFATIRMDPLPYTEDYFAVYNGAVILAANPYFNFARQIGLSSVATDGYVSDGSFASGSAFEGLNSLKLTVNVTLIVVFACIGFGILASGFVLGCLVAHKRWSKKQQSNYSSETKQDGSDKEQELRSLTTTLSQKDA